MLDLQQNTNSTIDPIREKWIAYASNPDRNTRNFFIAHYLPLVTKTAKQMHRRLQGHVELDDLISSGVLGLMSAIESFDPHRGFVFSTYCCHRIRGAILDEIRSMDWLPRTVRRDLRAYADARGDLMNTLGRAPDLNELADKMCVPVSKVINMQRNERRAHLVSLSTEMISGDNGCGREFGMCSLSEDRAHAPSHQLRDYFSGTQKGKLTRSEQLIVDLYYMEGMTFREVGRVLDLSESRVSQIHSSIIARHRERHSAPNAQVTGMKIGRQSPPQGKQPLGPLQHSMAA